MSRRQAGITIERRPPAQDRPPLEIRRSIRRRKTASAYARDGMIVVQLPAGMPPDREEEVIERFVARVSGSGREQEASDAELERRAHRLADRYLGGVRPSSVRWSDRMERRYGSCTTIDRRIRISRRIARFPDHVIDAVVLHELAHLLVPDHSPEFWALVNRYPEAARARGFLEGVEHAAAQPKDVD